MHIRTIARHDRQAVDPRRGHHEPIDGGNGPSKTPTSGSHGGPVIGNRLINGQNSLGKIPLEPLKPRPQAIATRPRGQRFDPTTSLAHHEDG